MLPDGFPCIFVNAGKDALGLASSSGYGHINVVGQFLFTHCDGGLDAAGDPVLRRTLVGFLPDDLSGLGVNFPYRNFRCGIASPSKTEGGADVQVKMSVLHGKHRGGVGVIQNVLYPHQLQGVQIQAHQIAAIVGHENIAVVDGCTVLHAKPVGSNTGSGSVIMPFHNRVRGDGQGACRWIIAGI